MEYTIPIYGIIGSPESKKDKEKYFSYTEFLSHINKAKNADIIHLDINSLGGYCDIADMMIADLLKLKQEGKTITSYNTGDVCSAASKLFTVADKEMRVFYPEKGEFLIHNPWSAVEGDAKIHLEVAKELKETEDQYIKWYSLTTDTDIDIITKLMAEDICLKEQEIEDFGFASIVKQQDINTELLALTKNKKVKAFAKLKFNKNMNEEKILTKIGVLETLINKFTKSHSKALMVADVDGQELDFPDISDITEITIGSKVVLDGSPATGEFFMPDGTKIIADGGVVTEIVVPVEDEPNDLTSENEALKAELDALKAELSTIKDGMTASAKSTETEKSEMLGTLAKLNSELLEIKALASKHKPDSSIVPEVQEEEKTTKRFAWKDKIKK